MRERERERERDSPSIGPPLSLPDKDLVQTRLSPCREETPVYWEKKSRRNIATVLQQQDVGLQRWPACSQTDVCSHTIKRWNGDIEKLLEIDGQTRIRQGYTYNIMGPKEREQLSWTWLKEKKKECDIEQGPKRDELVSQRKTPRYMWLVLRGGRDLDLGYKCQIDAHPLLPLPILRNMHFWWFLLAIHPYYLVYRKHIFSMSQCILMSNAVVGPSLTMDTISGTGHWPPPIFLCISYLYWLLIVSFIHLACVYLQSGL